MKKMNDKDNMTKILLDDELINDYEFGMRVYLTGLIEDMQGFSGENALIFSGIV